MTVPALYLRVSDPRQGENYSLPAQERACRALCVREGWSEPVIYREDGASAFTDDPDARPKFRDVLAAIESREVDRLVTLDTDRFARSVLAALLALARIEAVGAQVHFVNSPMDTLTPEGKMMFVIKASFDEAESARKSGRIRLSQELMRAEGKWLSRPPFGALIGPDGRLALNPDTAPLLRRILEEAATDADYRIAQRLTAEGIPTPGSDRAPGRWGGSTSGRWWPTTVEQLIKQSTWLARQPEPWPSIWLAAKERPCRPKATSARQIRLLSGLMRCRCGGVITYGGRRGPLDRLTVQCFGLRVRDTGTPCPYRKTYADVYEAAVLAALAALPDPARWRLRDADDRASDARRELEDEYQRLADVYRAGIYGKARFEAELATLDARKATLPTGSPRVAAMRDRWPVLRALLPTLPAAEQNVVARELIERLIITGPNVTIVWRPEFSAAFGPAAPR